MPSKGMFGGIDLRHLYFNAPPPPRGLSAHKPGLGERVQNRIAGGLEKVGVKPRTARRVAGKTAGILTDLTPVGDAATAEQAGIDWRKGNRLSAIAKGALAGVGSVPGFGDAIGKVAHSIIAPLWHGSPHKFDRFSLDKIGTGEGAQAYGHGLYFAENPAVAQEYQKSVTRNADEMVKVGHSNGLSNNAATLLAEQFNNGFGGKSFDAWLGQMRAAATNPFNNEKVRLTAQELINKAPETSRAVEALRAPGHLYEVSINANPEDFLDWDAPLSGQPDAVRSAYADAAIPGRATDPLLGDLIGSGPVPNSYLGLFDKSGGGQAYNELADRLMKQKNQIGLVAEYNAQRLAAERLKQSGVPGIKYFDQGSRRAGQGSRNIVVFDDSLIDILNRH